MKTEHLAEVRREILVQALHNAAFDGWGKRALHQATVAAGYDPVMADRAYPGGVSELITAYVVDTDQRMIAACENLNLTELKIRERIATIIRTRLNLMRPNREAVRQAATAQLLPFRGVAGLRQLAGTVDVMWHLAGDQSTDFNWYTKRALLAAVFASTVLFWLYDDSEEFEQTLGFLDRRIEAVMKIQKLRGNIETRLDKLPNPWRLAARLRYGDMAAAD